MYNDIIINFDDVKPINKDGRVMIPFNAVLEDMGATVKYDELKREVTAEKGDTTINFTLMDDTINVNKNGNKSTITMDVPMIIVEDRTLVPIRFMSDAFSMQIGWDGASETVIILDYNEYFDNLDNIAPNLTKMMSMKQPEFNKEYLNFGFAANIAETEYSISGKVDGTYADKTTGANVTVNVSKNNNEIKDSFINVVVQNGMC